MKLKIRQAKSNEIDTAFVLLKEAALWLQNRQIDYWQNWLNPPKLHKDWIREGFDKNEFYFVLNDSIIIGMFRLQWSDELFWGPQKNDSGYLHSFTIKRQYYGQDIGRTVLELIKNLCKENNKSFLRLDCGTEIKNLCRYYENLGFSAVGEVELESEKLKLYEISL